MDTTIKRKRFDSSNIASAGYNADTRTLEIEFNSGQVYRYHPVTETSWVDMQKAKSTGSWFWANVRNNKNITTEKQ